MALEVEWLQKTEEKYYQIEEKKEDGNLPFPMRFSKSKYILRKKNDIDFLLQKGKIIYTKDLKIYFYTNNLNYLRYFISASKKWGKSNKRNRFKRIVREAMREILKQYNFSIDLAIFPNKNLPSYLVKKYKTYIIQEQILNFLKYQKIIN